MRRGLGVQQLRPTPTSRAPNRDRRATSHPELVTFCKSLHRKHFAALEQEGLSWLTFGGFAASGPLAGLRPAPAASGRTRRPQEGQLRRPPAMSWRLSCLVPYYRWPYIPHSSILRRRTLHLVLGDPAVKLLFVETTQFTKGITAEGWAEDLRELQQELLINPEKGPPEPGTGGLRKVRMRL